MGWDGIPNYAYPCIEIQKKLLLRYLSCPCTPYFPSMYLMSTIVEAVADLHRPILLLLYPLKAFQWSW